MKLCYLVLDSRRQLRKVKTSAVEAFWEGWLGARELGCPSETELRLVSAVCDNRLRPKKIYLLRLPLLDGYFTSECFHRVQCFLRPDCVTEEEAFQHHTQGWPQNFFHQLAVALDVPILQLNVPMGIGGPLLVASTMRITTRQALRFLK